MAIRNEAKATHPGKLGDHPVGGAVGAAMGAATVAAAAAQGAAAGTVAGPVGVAAGLAAGAVAGAFAGKSLAQLVNPTTEDAYWQNHYSDRDYVTPGESYDAYRPAYRHGVNAYNKYQGKPFDEIEPEISKEWEKARGTSTLPWERAKPASRDAYERIHSLREEDEGL